MKTSEKRSFVSMRTDAACAEHVSRPERPSFPEHYEDQQAENDHDDRAGDEQCHHGAYCRRSACPVQCARCYSVEPLRPASRLTPTKGQCRATQASPLPPRRRRQVLRRIVHSRSLEPVTPFAALAAEPAVSSARRVHARERQLEGDAKRRAQ